MITGGRIERKDVAGRGGEVRGGVGAGRAAAVHGADDSGRVGDGVERHHQGGGRQESCPLRAVLSTSALLIL